MLVALVKYSAMSQCCRCVSFVCRWIKCLMIGLLCVINSCMIWVGLVSSLSRGREKMCQSLGRTSNEHEYMNIEHALGMQLWGEFLERGCCRCGVGCFGQTIGGWLPVVWYVWVGWLVWSHWGGRCSVGQSSVNWRSHKNKQTTRCWELVADEKVWEGGGLSSRKEIRCSVSWHSRRSFALCLQHSFSRGSKRCCTKSGFLHIWESVHLFRLWFYIVDMRVRGKSCIGVVFFVWVRNCDTITFPLMKIAPMLSTQIAPDRCT